MVLAKCLAIAGASCRMKALQYVVKNARTSAVTLLLDFSVTACGLFRSRPDPDNLAGGGYWLDVFGLSANVTGFAEAPLAVLALLHRKPEHLVEKRQQRRGSQAHRQARRAA